MLTKPLNWFIFLNFLAILVTAYLTSLHYDSGLAAPCAINSFFDCGVGKQKSLRHSLWYSSRRAWAHKLHLFIHCRLSLSQKQRTSKQKNSPIPSANLQHWSPFLSVFNLRRAFHY